MLLAGHCQKIKEKNCELGKLEANSQMIDNFGLREPISIFFKHKFERNTIRQKQFLNIFMQTLYRVNDNKNSRSLMVSGLMSDSLSRRLPTLPLWTVLQALGKDGILNRFKQCFLNIEELYYKIKK